ncbi:FadD3 family acyl-CoA ligase [Spirillospora sp. NBC_01491]|nr:FadD3 family acyl-CoA ligase [Spirillospora sp. NBC_01491]MDL4770670.1 FadD3 family acyl-CoA ligase [Actinomadura xylanilytica]
MDEHALMTIPAILERVAREIPDAEAVVDGTVRLTYAGLRARVRVAARAFIAAGIGPGDRIAIWAPNGVPWIVTALGAACAGAVLVPVNTRYKGEEARWPLTRSGARMVFVEDGFLGKDYLGMLGAGTEGAPEGVTAVTFGATAGPGATAWEDFLAAGAAVPEAEADAREAAVTADDIADVLFTSGTTGRPKGVMCTHGQDVRTYLAWSGRTGIRRGDRYLIVNPMFHSFGYKAGVLACLLVGATMVLQDVFEAAETARLIEAERITVLPGPPTIYTSLLDAPRERDLSSLRLAVTGASTVPVALISRMRAELFPEVVTAYGLTESCGTVTACSLGDDDTTVATTCGRPIEGVEIVIAGPDGTPVEPGASGEVMVRGHNVMRGYLGDPEGTRETIRDGWLATGDLGRLDPAGNLIITGRSKDMFVVGGFNVYPAEVEQVLARHPAVSEAAVIGVPDERMGEVGRAYVRARPGTGPAAADLVAHCRDLLANFKVPREIVFVAELPRNAAGKVEKARLPGSPLVSGR